MPVFEESFGKMPDGQDIKRFTMSTPDGIEARFISYGARLSELHVPDSRGERKSVVLGFASLDKYLGRDPYFGAMVGRVANRIAGAKFDLDGKTWHLSANEKGNTLHGGKVGLDRRVWTGRIVESGDAPAIDLTYNSPNLEEGFPGDMKITVRCSLKNSAVRLEYYATTTQACPVNLTNHSYFNLAGAGSGDVLGHVLHIAAEEYTPVDAALIPTGQILPVAGTPLDFRRPAAIGARIGETATGYDMNYVLDRVERKLALSARVVEPKSGRVMEVWSSQPGVQFYSGQVLDGSHVGVGGAYDKFGGLALEPQHFPDSVHHANFPGTILRPGQESRHAVEYRFSTE